MNSPERVCSGNPNRPDPCSRQDNDNADKLLPEINDRGAAWKMQSARWREELEVTPDYHPYTSNMDFSRSGLPCKCGGRPTKRILDLIDCAAMSVAKKAKKRLGDCKQELDRTILDVSQSHGRRPFNTGDVRTLTTSSKLFSFGQRRTLVEKEHFLLMGFDDQLVLPKAISASNLRALAGEGMALPCLATVVIAVLLTSKDFV